MKRSARAFSTFWTGTKKRSAAFLSYPKSRAFVPNNREIMSIKKKIISAATLILLVAAALFFYFKFYYVFGEGVKAGELNFVVYKGYVWKTYEGRAIQAGFQKGVKGATTAIQSYEFDFSVEDQAIADTLMRCSGREVQLHYKEYLGALPWRGQQKYIVDRILSVK